MDLVVSKFYCLCWPMVYIYIFKGIHIDGTFGIFGIKWSNYLQLTENRSSKPYIKPLASYEMPLTWAIHDVIVFVIFILPCSCSVQALLTAIKHRTHKPLFQF